MSDHLADIAAVEHIAKRAESYLHIARRLVVDMFGPEAGKEQVHVIATVASMMATLENAEILASTQDKMNEILKGA